MPGGTGIKQMRSHRTLDPTFIWEPMSNLGDPEYLVGLSTSADPFFPPSRTQRFWEDGLLISDYMVGTLRGLQMGRSVWVGFPKFNMFVGLLTMNR